MISAQRLQKAGSLVFFALVVAFMLLPLIVVVGVSFNTSSLVFPPRDWALDAYREIPESLIRAFSVSIRLGIAATVAAVILAVPAAVGIVRGPRRLTNVAEAFFRSPIQVPALVIGAALFQAYLLLGRATDIGLRGTFAGLMLGHVIIVTPFVLGPIVSRLHGIDPALEMAAHGLGASAARTFFTITLLLMRPGIVAGAFLGFLISFDEVPATIFLTGPTTGTLPVALFLNAEVSLSPTIFAASALTLVVAMVLAVLGDRFGGLRSFLAEQQ